MKTKQVHTANRLVVVSLTYFVLALMLLSTVLYAWFSLTNTNRAFVTSTTSGVEAEYEFYVFKNSNKDGAEGKIISDDTCEIGEEDMCYMPIENPNDITFIDGFAAPGERYSFAVKVTSVGAAGGYLRLDLSGVISLGFTESQNRIQRAFKYETTMINYIGITGESSDQKDTLGLNYNVSHFANATTGPYNLVNDIPFGSDYDTNGIVVIYFDLYFDPFVYGEDIFGTPYTNSNIFMGQIIQVTFIYMTIYCWCPIIC